MLLARATARAGPVPASHAQVRFLHRSPLQARQSRAHKHLVVQEARNGISGESKDQGATPPAEPQGLAGLDGDLVKDLLHTQLQECIGHEIVAPHAHTAGRQHDVRSLEGFTEALN